MKNKEKPSSSKPGKIPAGTSLAISTFIGLTLLFSVFVPALAGKEEGRKEEKNIQISTEYQVVKTGKYRVTAYNSEVAQTDSEPCITASGFNLCENNEENIIAANFLPMGTKVRIPEYYGDQIFTVEDRMASRFGNTVDIWMKNKKDAINFGVKKQVTIEILEEIIPSKDHQLALSN